jgi:hypothetical protein
MKPRSNASKTIETVWPLPRSNSTLTTVRDPGAIEVRHFLELPAFGRLLEQQGLLPDGTSA